MKIKEGLIKRKVAGKWLVVAVGELSRSYHAMIELNETASDIWDGLAEGKDATQIAQTLSEKYEVSQEEAEASTRTLIAQMQGEGLLV